MRKLRYKLSEDEMEELEFDILNTMERKRFNAAATSRQASSAIQQSSLSLSVSRKRDYPTQQPDVPDIHQHEHRDRDGHDQPPIPVVIPETGECQETEDDDVESTTLVEVDDDNDDDEEAVYEQQQQGSPPSS